MKVQEAIKQIKKGEFQPNYLLLGSESYLQSTFMSSLTAALSAADELDVMHIDLNVDTIQAVLDEAELYSFFTEYFSTEYSAILENPFLCFYNNTLIVCVQYFSS